MSGASNGGTEPVETLAERVRGGIGVWREDETLRARSEQALAALTELVERLSRTEDAERLADQRYFEAIERLEAQGRKLSCGYDTGTGQNCGECLDCLKVNWHFAQEAVTNLRERLEAAERDYSEVLADFHDQRQRREAAEARVAALEEALREALDIIVWMSGADDFSPGGKAEEGWKKARDQLDRLFLVARAALRVEGDA